MTYLVMLRKNITDLFFVCFNEKLDLIEIQQRNKHQTLI
jgi:hypothetical protein